MSEDNVSTITADDAVPPAGGAKSAVSPGEMLRRARESLNLTISDLAGQTRLSRAVLDALEKNDFASLAMPVYVRGYFRKCAHVLNLPEESLLQAYAEWTGTSLKPQPLPVTVSEPPPEYDSPSRTPSWRYILVVAIVIGAALWWFSSGSNTTPAPVAELTSPQTAPELEPQVSAPAPLPLPLVNEVDGVATDPMTPAPSAISGGASPTAVPPATTVASAGTLASTPTPAQPPAGPNTLQLSVTSASWVEIYDDDRKRLLYDLLNPGTEHRVTGKPPYDVVLGHPQGVKLSIGGKAIDLAPHTSGNGTARFEVEGP